MIRRFSQARMIRPATPQQSRAWEPDHALSAPPPGPAARVLAAAHALCGYGSHETGAIGVALSPIAVSVFLSGMDRHVPDPSETREAAEGGRFLEGFHSLERFVTSGFQSLDRDRQQAVLVALAAAMDGSVGRGGELVDIGEGGRRVLARPGRPRAGLLPGRRGDARVPDAGAGRPVPGLGRAARRRLRIVRPQGHVGSPGGNPAPRGREACRKAPDSLLRDVSSPEGKRRGSAPQPWAKRNTRRCAC